MNKILTSVDVYRLGLDKKNSIFQQPICKITMKSAVKCSRRQELSL